MSLLKSRISVGSALGFLILLVVLLVRFLNRPILSSKAPNAPSVNPNLYNLNLSSALDKAWLNSGFPDLYKQFWLMVSRMETSGFTSKNFKDFKNPWNMERPQHRPSHDYKPFYQFDKSRWAYYKTLNDAALDITDYMRAEKFPKDITTIQDFVVEMGKHGYYGDEANLSYFNKVKAWNKT